MCYALPYSNKLVAIVYLDSLGRGWIIGRTAGGMDLSPMLPEKELEIVPETIIPVQIENPGEEHTYGVLLFAPHKALFIKTGSGYFASEEAGRSIKGKGKPKSNRSKSEVKAEIQANMVTVDTPYRDIAAWTQVDGKHLIIGDSLGRLYLLTMSMEPQFTMACTILGDASVPSTLSYLSNNIFYIGSLSGPSQLVRISDQIASGENSASRGKKKQPDDEATYLELGARIIAAIGYGVYLYNIGKDGLTISNPVARWERGYLVHDIIVRPNMLVVSDALRSISVLRLVERTELSDLGGMEEEDSTILQFETVAMDMHAIWPTSVEVLSDNKTIIASQVDGNILTWELEDGNLEPRAAFHTGEVIQKFIASTAKTTTGPRAVAIFVTNTGRIGTLLTVDDSDALRLTRLEMKMGDVTKGLGDIDHSEWRAPKHLHTGSKPPPRRGVTDGDFIKKFLELDPEEAKKILSAGSAAESIGPSEESQIRACLDAVSTEQ
ncbi:hypothetical protein RSOLAG22IIIB_04940 [Rhizoctonia solani]|uniref:Uncharacterized protein n=1 Tax=Rhizoctonia solani TaxID=456999 RepID=A0A0K6G206_9AGAM|nr:hypothetical protein RSOLAG22IIIB_04940 [Rhizoctonia solani]